MSTYDPNSAVVLARLLKAEGLVAAYEGVRGGARESEGVAREDEGMQGRARA